MKFIYLVIIILFIPSTIILNAIDGKGTKDEPFLIANIYEMQDIIEDDTLLYYKLANDIDASETRYWNVGDHDGNPNTPEEPMGFRPIGFHGFLNGDGHIINKLYINRPSESCIGLICSLNADNQNADSVKIIKLGIENCDITGGYSVGSLCATIELGHIEECYSTGKVLSMEKYAEGWTSGFCGRNALWEIINCYSSCTVTSYSDEYDKYDYNLASFSNAIARNNSATNSYTVGRVISKKKVSAFGENENAKNCFWDVETTGIPDTGGHVARGLPTSEMKKKATYVNAGWDFDSVWCIDEGKDYPKLRVFGKCPPTDVQQEPTKENKFIISPNPFSSSFNIYFINKSSSGVSLDIYDILGNKIYTKNLGFLESGKQTATINMDENYIPGCYLVVVRSGADIQSLKVVKSE